MIYASIAKRSPSFILNVTIPGAMKNYADGVKVRKIIPLDASHLHHLRQYSCCLEHLPKLASAD